MVKGLMVTLFFVLLGAPALAGEITSVAPGRGTPGDSVTVTGGPFTAQSRLFLGEQSAAIRLRQPRQLEFTVPDLPAGSYALTVEGEDTDSGSPFFFEILPAAPQVTALVPERLEVCAEEGEPPLQVSGSGFHQAARVLVDGKIVASRTIDAATIEVNFGELTAGSYAIEVRNPDGAGSLPRRLEVSGTPQIDGVEQGGAFVTYYELTVRGRNFAPDATLIVTEPAELFMEGTNRQRRYTTRSSGAVFDPNTPGEQLRFIDCRRLEMIRYPVNFQDRELTLQVVNGDGRRSEPFRVLLP